ncbi:hypothetical protein [Spirillospora albida]|uniref:hypothetical protein n=1 Tax=Spirillospora albida TaxID=58123 RepID=UPI0004C1DCBC|nr:hypothetical protein [Spirillospora albida]
MDAGDWIALGVGTASVMIAIVALRYSRSSAASSARSAAAGQDSAQAAERSAQKAERLSDIETERRHEHLAPEHPGEIVADQERRDGHASLFGEITVKRAYRVQAFAESGGSTSPISGLPTLLEPYVPHRFHIEHMPEGRGIPRTERVLFKFWPPVEGVDGDAPWTCPCGRPTGQDTNRDGHWEHRIPVTRADPTQNLW